MNGSDIDGSEVVVTINGRDVTRAELQRDIEAKVTGGELRRYRVSFILGDPGVFLWDRMEHRRVYTADSPKAMREALPGLGIAPDAVDYL